MNKRAKRCGNRRIMSLPRPFPVVVRCAPAHSVRERCYATDEAQGRIFQPCDGTETIYYRAAIPPDAALVLVGNDSACSMQIELVMADGSLLTGTVNQGQQISYDVQGLQVLRIRCTGEGGIGRGTYQIQLRREL
ncbi:hypothetical protein IDH44_04910 [Paenibacillus sp. IB182496]|uniref:Endospore appendages core domain-containing protein n=1 Tax=Paenibacillus sabuli TaxID=2772509 RepID=A0A927BQR1_9BACL|nr:S-Ena type endospore appendage [Paenibacillus sabuli]MBD2844522.1 hypothetical protein [Paenibacillus sabuli]